MAAVLQSKERVKEVHIEGLALLKIVKHCHESLPLMVTGSLLGLTSGSGILEVTHSFPFPDSVKHQQSQNSDGDNEDGGLEGHEFQMEMMRMLREVNVDNNCVGWYQSMYLGNYSTSHFLENQLSYQTDLSPHAVVILYDPMQTANGNLVLKCFRLSQEFLKMKQQSKNAYLDPSKIFEPVPVKLVNPGLCRALLADVVLSTAAKGNDDNEAAAATDGLLPLGADTTFDRLDLSTNPYLEKHLEHLSGWVDDLANEQQKFQYFARQLARGSGGNDRRGGRGRNNKQESSDAASAAEAWASSEAPSRLESLLISNQIRNYVDQMDGFAGAGLGKLYLAGSLHRGGDDKAAGAAATSSKTSA